MHPRCTEDATEIPSHSFFILSVCMQIFLGASGNICFPQLQVLEWPIEFSPLSETVSIEPSVKIPNVTAEINMFTAWYSKWFLGL